MKKFILLAVTFLIFAAVPDIAAQQRRARRVTQNKKATTTATVRERQRDNKKAIKETSHKLELNRAELNRKLNDLNAVTADINSLNREIAACTAAINAIDTRIRELTDSIAILDDRLSAMSAKYGAAVQKIAQRNRNATSNLAFIFSAESVSQAYRRSRSLEQVSKWRARKAHEIEVLKKDLADRRKELEGLKEKRVRSLAELTANMEELSRKKERSDALVAVLQRESRNLKSLLEVKEREARNLEAELQRVIEAEQKALEEEQERQALEQQRREAEEAARLKAEQELKAGQQKKADQAKKNDGKKDKKKKDKKGKEQQPDQLTVKPVPAEKKAPKSQPATQPHKNTAPPAASRGGDFASNRGNITFPVEGQYRIVKHFGRSKHPELKYVETDNPGIDIETSSGARVRAAFDGRVSDIFRIPGYNTVVMIRHGRYLTVYAGLGSITVRKGDEVKNGQVIGTVFADSEDDGRSILHFEIRNEKAKENPESWLAKL